MHLCRMTSKKNMRAEMNTQVPLCVFVIKKKIKKNILQDEHKKGGKKNFITILMSSKNDADLIFSPQRSCILQVDN